MQDVFLVLVVILLLLVIIKRRQAPSKKGPQNEDPNLKFIITLA